MKADRFERESADRLEMARQFNVCARCQRCVALCGVFPLAFDQISLTPDGDAASCTPHQQDRVAALCTACGECASLCPHAGLPERVDIETILKDVQGYAVRSRLGWKRKFRRRRDRP